MAFELVSQKTWDDTLKSLNLELQEPVKVSDLAEFVPSRSTSGSAGYDFRMPFNLKVYSGHEVLIPTGFKWNPRDARIRTLMANPGGMAVGGDMFVGRDDFITSCFLALYPRSSLGFKYGFRLLNTCGIIDSDYYNNESNEGHIIIGFIINKEMILDLKKGEKFCQGIIQPYAFDSCKNDSIRTGGIGSTGTL